MGKSESSKKAIAMTIITALVTRALKTHPKKAVYFFLLQKSLMFSWRLARKYFKD